MQNPYLNRLPIREPGEFFGRGEDVLWLLERILYSEPQCCSLTGLRRIGKSSLLRFLAHPDGALARDGRGFRPDGPLLMVYVDLSRDGPLDGGGSEVAATMTLRHILRRLVQEGQAALGENGAARLAALRPALAQGWQETLEALVDALELLGAARARTIFLLDELDVAAAWHPRLAFALRALVMEHAIAYVTASLEPLFELISSEGHTSPLYNLFSSRPLGLLEPPDARALLVEPARRLGVTWADALTANLLAAVGGHPDLVKMAGSHLWELLQQGKNQPEAEAVLAALRPDAGALFASLRSHLNEAEWRAVVALACGRPGDDAASTLPALRQRALVPAGEARLFGTLFAEWVRQQPDAAPPAPDLRLDGRWLFINGQGRQLTPTEARLARLLLSRRGQTVSRDELQRAVWNQADPDSKALDTTVQRLREKIEDDRAAPRWLVTVRGEGYAFVG